MIFDLSKNNPYDRQAFIDRVKDYLDKGYAVSLTRKKEQRSVAQNRYFYLILAFFGAEFGLSVEEVKIDIFKRLCNPELFIRTKTNKHNQQVQYLRSSAELSTAEMTTAIDRFRNFAAAQCNIYIPSPDDRQFAIHCEKLIEQNKEYL